MQVTIQSVKDVKQGQYGLSSKIVTNAGEFFVNEDATARVGKSFEIEVTEKTSAQGRQYKIAKLVKEIAGAVAQASGNGYAHKLDDFIFVAHEAHKLACELEPDGVASPPAGSEEQPITTIDRSRARAAIVNTFVMAFSKGQIAIPSADDIPF